MIKKTGYGAKLAFAEFFICCGIAFRSEEQGGPAVGLGREIHALGRKSRRWIRQPAMHDCAAIERRLRKSTSGAPNRRRRTVAA